MVSDVSDTPATRALIGGVSDVSDTFLERPWGAVDDELGAGGGADLLYGRIGRDLFQHQPAIGHLDDGQLGDDFIDDLRAGERKRALLQDLVAAVLRGVLHG